MTQPQNRVAAHTLGAAARRLQVGRGHVGWTHMAGAGPYVSAEQATSCHANECSGLSCGQVLGWWKVLWADDHISGSLFSQLWKQWGN